MPLAQGECCALLLNSGFCEFNIATGCDAVHFLNSKFSLNLSLTQGGMLCNFSKSMFLCEFTIATGCDAVHFFNSKYLLFLALTQRECCAFLQNLSFVL